MPRPHSTMRKTRDVLRLHFGEGLSLRQTASSLSMPFTTVADLVKEPKQPVSAGRWMILTTTRSIDDYFNRLLPLHQLIPNPISPPWSASCATKGLLDNCYGWNTGNSTPMSMATPSFVISRTSGVAN